MEKEIKNKVSKDGRAEKTKASFMKKLKQQYKFSLDEKVLEEVALKADTNIFNGKWNLSKKELQKILFSNGSLQIFINQAEYLQLFTLL